jgi:hypothetical protein
MAARGRFKGSKIIKHASFQKKINSIQAIKYYLFWWPFKVERLNIMDLSS